MQTEELFAFMFGLIIVSGVAIVIMGLRQRSHQLELQHRERMAMIERGIVPAPEGAHAGGRRLGGGVPRSISLGIVVVAVGLGLMTLIGVAFGEAGAGVGIGGAIAIVGTAFIIKGMVTQRLSGGESPPPDPLL